MAAVTTVSSQGPARRAIPLENGDLSIYFLSSIDSTDTFTPFPLTGAFPRSIVGWAIQPVADPDDPVDSSGTLATSASYGYNQVNVGDGEQMKVVYTKATASAAAYFTFTCTAGSGYAYLYLWAK